MTVGAWFVEWAPHLLFAAVLWGGSRALLIPAAIMLVGVFLIRGHSGRGPPEFALFMLLACVAAFMTAPIILFSVID